MALIKCNECGNMVSDKADFCPKCGAAIEKAASQRQSYYDEQTYYSPEKKSHALLYVIIGILSLAIIGGLVYLFLNQRPQGQDDLKKIKQQTEELEEQNEKLQEQVKEAQKEASEAKQQKVIVKQGAVHAAEHRAVSAGTAGRTPKVVVNGNKVRLRFAPSLNAGYLTWGDGSIRSVPKYTKLQYGGWEDGDWYRVIYEGVQFYISKEFSYLEY